MYPFFLFLTALLSMLLLTAAFNYRSRKRIERYMLAPKCALGDEQFCRSMTGILGDPFTAGNRIKTLQDGREIFPAMIEAIHSAQRTITFESFVFSSGKVCAAVIAALKQRAAAGVRVHLTLDWLGSSSLNVRQYRELKRSGIQVVMHRRLHWYNLTRLNNRSHRKILVIDGKIGFTGGVGIADQWLHAMDGMPSWRDLHYRVQGPVVAKMQSVFLDNWLKGHARVLEGEGYFPSLEAAGGLKAQVFRSSPVDGPETVRLMFLFSMACAKRTIRILNAYFVPDRACIEAILRARRRGVEVEIIVPGKKTDQRFLRSVSRAGWRDLLRAGVRIYEYRPTMHHGKLFIVDDLFVSIGSANFDGRSFLLNDEMNVNVLDEGFAREQTRLFEGDKAESDLMTLERWRTRSLLDRILGSIGQVILSQF